MSKPFKPAPGIGERLLQLRGKMTREEFANHIGLHAASIGNYERGNRKIDVDTLQAIAEKTDADLNWLITGSSRQTHQEIISTPAGQIAIPSYSVAASAGGGRLVGLQEPDSFMNVTHSWLDRFGVNAKDVFALMVAGDSMEPTLMDHDLILVDRSVTRDQIYTGGGIYVFSEREFTRVKRLLASFSERKIGITSDNPRYPPESVSMDDFDAEYTIHGRVFWSGGKLQYRG